MYLVITLFSRMTLLGVVIFFSLQFYKTKESFAKLFVSGKPLILGIFGGTFGIVGTILGLSYKGAIINYRDMGVIIASLYGGLPAALLSSSIASTHRFLLGGPSGLACAIGTLSAGIFSSFFRKQFERSKNKVVFGCLLSAISELVHLFVAYLIITPRSLAADIVSNALFPMVITNAFGVALILALTIYTEDAVRATTSQVFKVTLGTVEEGIKFVEDPKPDNLVKFAQKISHVLNVDKVLISLDRDSQVGEDYSTTKVCIPLKSKDGTIGNLIVINSAELQKEQVLMIREIAKFIEIIALAAKAVKEAILAREAQMRDFMSKLGPHFLFNTLASIRYLVATDEDKAIEMIDELSQLLRYYFEKKGPFVALDEEMSMIEYYLSIMKLRFGESLNYEIDVPENLKQYLIPPMILQPIVENAIEHGEKDGTIAVRIKAKQKDQYLSIRISDEGRGMKPGSKKGVGMMLVETRLKNLYSNRARIEYKNKNGLTVTVSIPVEESYDKSSCLGR
ncbi:MAG: LytS/YhcK type 5TM receptor domain-containing protein [Pseudothermotoga sp.]